MDAFVCWIGSGFRQLVSEHDISSFSWRLFVVNELRLVVSAAGQAVVLRGRRICAVLMVY